jgi:hypothetical protein
MTWPGPPIAAALRAEIWLRLLSRRAPVLIDVKQTTSARIELRSRIADPMAPSKRGMAFSGIGIRSRNCCGVARTRASGASVAMINDGINDGIAAGRRT